jgi:hypothetical protein
MRAIEHVHGDKAPHWVGDGFYVKTLINHLEASPDFNYTHTDPFLLFDYGEPTTFAPNPDAESQPQGIGQHPHKGFETVMVAYSGEISHADSTGGSGVLVEGDVQWMTAGRGILHEEFHSAAFGQRGGVFSMVQMWINLPRADKLTDPKYQTIRRADMPTVELTTHNDIGEQVPIGKAAIIAGDWHGTLGAASTFTPVNLWDIELRAAGSTTLQVPNTHNVMLLVQEGELLINDTLVNSGKLVQFTAPINLDEQDLPAEHAATDVITLTIPATPDGVPTMAPVKVLLLSGEPIGEPVAGYGPFVMTTQEELKQTFRDYQQGNFG